MKILTYALLPLILIAWLIWRAHERRVLTAAACSQGYDYELPEPSAELEAWIDNVWERVTK